MSPDFIGMNYSWVVLFQSCFENTSSPSQKKCECDQEIPQSHTADQPTVPRGRATEHLQ